MARTVLLLCLRALLLLLLALFMLEVRSWSIAWPISSVDPLASSIFSVSFPIAFLFVAMASRVARLSPREDLQKIDAFVLHPANERDYALAFQGVNVLLWHARPSQPFVKSPSCKL